MVVQLERGVSVILSILATNKKELVIYLLVSAITLIFSLVYAQFSHNVYSPYMQYAFLIPLVLGGGGTLLLAKLKIKVASKKKIIYRLLVATILVYSIIRGVLEIYGTTNSLLNVYLIASAFLLGMLVIIKDNKN